METTTITKLVDAVDLEEKVKKMYRDVALQPQGDYHFEMGRTLAEKLGYEKEILNNIPEASIESFAGVGYYFDMANIKPGDKVLDLGSGSGMDSFIAALKTGDKGKVIGIDMTNEQLHKASGLAKKSGFNNVEFIKAYIQKLPLDNNSFDVVISNGVINLSPEKEKVFVEAYRALKPGGRLALADIVSEKQLPDNIICNSTLWASCIGGAAQQDYYKLIIERAGFKVRKIRENNSYEFISISALGATKQYGVKSVSIFAEK